MGNGSSASKQRVRSIVTPLDKFPTFSPYLNNVFQIKGGGGEGAGFYVHCEFVCWTYRVSRLGGGRDRGKRTDVFPGSERSCTVRARCAV